MIHPDDELVTANIWYKDYLTPEELLSKQSTGRKWAIKNTDLYILLDSNQVLKITAEHRLELHDINEIDLPDRLLLYK